MPRHLSSRQVSELVARRLTPVELSIAMQHLAECDDCRTQVNTANQTEERFSALQAMIQANLGNAPDHLSYEQLSGFVDQSLAENERGEVKSHLESCDDCMARTQELEELWTVIRTDASDSPRQIIQQPKRKKAGWFGSLTLSGLQPRWGLAAIALTAALLAIGSIWWRQQSRGLIAHTDSTPAASPTGTVTAPAQVPASPSPAEYLAALTDHGQRIALDEQGNLTGLPPLPATYEQVVKAALVKQRVSLSPAASELNSSRGTLLGSGNETEAFALLAPVGIVVINDRPAFRWQKVDGADSYSVAVLDQKLNVVAKSEPLSETNWTPPNALPRNQVLLWQVTATVGKKQVTSPVPPMPEARFKILPQAKASELSRAAKDYSSSHLLLGLLYAEAGLAAEAEREFRALRAENPNSPLAQNLLRSLSQRAAAR